MDFSYTNEQLLTQKTARDFANTELAANAKPLDNDKNAHIYNENIQKLSKLGFMGMLVDEEYHGSQAGTVAYTLAITEIARHCAATAVGVSINNLISSLLFTFGTEQQKEKYLKPLCLGEKLNAGFCLTESSAGSNPAQMKTSAQLIKKNNKQQWQLNGSKQWITNGNISDFYIVWARSDSEAEEGKGITCFIVDRDTEGLEVGPNEDKMGQRGNPTNTIFFNNCLIPQENIIGSVHEGYKYAIGGLVGGRLGIAALALGVASEALDFSTRYMLEREQGGKKIAYHQGLQWMLSDAWTDLEAGRLLLHQAAWLKDNDMPYTKQASMAKLYCSDKGNKICYNALQLTGGYGFTKDFPLERYCRDIRVTSIYEGTSEIQKLIISRCILQEFNANL